MSEIRQEAEAGFYGSNRRALHWFGAGLSLLMFAVVVSLSYSLGVRDAETGAVPLIRADGQPLKTRPENPGGKQYPYQNISVYNDTSGAAGSEDMSRYSLLPEPEKPARHSPAEKAALAQAEKAAASIFQKTEKDKSDKSPAFAALTKTPKRDSKEKDDTPKMRTMSVEDIINRNIDDPKRETSDYRKNIISAKKPDRYAVLTEKKTKAFSESARDSVKSGYLLQLGAYRSEKEASAAWSRINVKTGRLIDGHNKIVTRADLGAKGVFYRLRVGPFRDKNAALSLCNQLKSKSQACMFISQ